MEIAIVNRVLNFVLARGWTDYDNFSSKLAHRIAESEPSNKAEIADIVQKFSSPFFDLNSVEKDAFARAFPHEEILSVIRSQKPLRPLTFIDVFDETSKIGLEEGRKLLEKLEGLDERTIQNALRDSLREKNATNAVERKHDSSIEVADLEHFFLRIGETPRSFAVVVKGYKSVKGKTINWEKIAHQVFKTYQRTNPDFVILVLAKDPADTVISESVEYGKSVRKVGLVILCDPVTLCRFLRARGVL